MAKLTSDARNKLKSSSFALPGRRFPVPDRAHAANAKARATQGVAKGTLSPAQAATVRRKANRVLGTNGTGVTQDLNAAELGKRAIPRANGSDNRNPKTPYQADQNNWKSNPAQRGPKFMSDSQGKGRADDSGVGKSYSGQPKFGGTVAESTNKKSAVKVSGGTPETGKSYKGQEKLGGTGMSSNGGKRYANGSSSHDSMKTMIRDH